ncbi:MAG: aconitate hydratase, partial [Anaerococcus sp.]|nr:aconitate hydratase [Anaerococcus sp.]
PFRSNIAYLSDFAFTTKIGDFKERSEKYKGGIILAGENYGQGSSREHAALIPLYLGIKAVVAKSFARIHRSNLINNAIIPLEFVNPDDYEKIDEYDDIRISNIREDREKGEFILEDLTKDIKIRLKADLSEREKEILLEGGYLNYAKGLEL